MVTAPGHAQRLTIRNHLWRRAPYTVTLHPGEGATATPDRIRGGVPARGVVTLRLHNETELSDGSVDTVALHRGGYDE